MISDRELVDIALSMREKSYCPYSHFAVGAALECADGTVYTGCNIENAAFSPTICAERAAVAKAVSDGKREFVRIAVAGSSDDKCTPCGVCRQVLCEFSPGMRVLCSDKTGDFESVPLSQLLPRSFGASSM